MFESIDLKQADIKTVKCLSQQFEIIKDKAT